MKTSKPVLIGAAAVAAVGAYLIFGTVGASNVPENIAFGNGRIEAVQVDISTRIAGRVKEISAKEGDLVKSGDVVALMDSAQIKAQLLRARADVASAESQVAAARASVAQMKAQLVLAEQELKRTSAPSLTLGCRI